MFYSLSLIHCHESSSIRETKNVNMMATHNTLQDKRLTVAVLKKDYTVLLIQLDRNLASEVSTRCSGRPQGMKTGVKTR